MSLKTRFCRNKVRSKMLHHPTRPPVKQMCKLDEASEKLEKGWKRARVNIKPKKHDDYVSGPHDYWIHFWWGLAFGAGIGAWIDWRWFDGGWRGAPALIVVALAAAYACGRWGDRAWQMILALLGW